MAKRRITYSFGADLSELERAVKRINSKLGQLGREAERMGKMMTKAFTIPLAGIGAASTKAAIDFESAFAGVRKTVDATEAEFKKLERGIRDMAKQIPASAVEISKVAEAAGQLGIQNDAILTFTRTMIDLGEATNLSAEEAASALAQFANVTQMSQKDFDRLGSVIVALGNNLATTERDIVEMGQRLAGAGKQAGLTEAQIMALAGALASVGIEAQAGGSAFSRLLSNMQLAVETGNKNLQNFAAVAGMSAAQFKQAFQQDAAGALMAFINGLANAQSRGVSAVKVLDDMGISEVRLRDALLRAAGASSVFSQALSIGSKAWEENNALTEEARKRYETAASQLKILRNRINEVAIDIGGQLVPSLLKAVEKMASLTESFQKLSPEAQNSIIKIAAVLAAGGPLLLGLAAATRAVQTLGAAFIALSTGPAAPLVIATAGVLALVASLRELEDVQKKVTGRTAQESMMRSRFMGQAGEIYKERYGKYPVTAKEYEELNKIIDELISNMDKLDEARSKAMAPPKVVTAAPATTGAGAGAGAGAGVINITGGKLAVEQKAAAEDALRKQQEYVRQIGVVTTAEIERINAIKQAQLEAQEAAARGVAKFWQDVNWEYSQGLIDAQNYFEMLQGELTRVTQGSEEWKTIFSELQRVGQDIASINISNLSDQLEEGKITVEEYKQALEALKTQFQDLPLVVKAIDKAIENVGSTAAKSSDFAKALGMTFESAFENAIVKGDDLRSVMSGLLEDITRLILRMYVVIPLVNSVMGFMSSAFGLPAVKMHGGGVVGAGGTISLVPAGTFIGAPRLHDGLASDEFPAILQKGEIVLPKGFGQNNIDVQPNIKIINVLDPSIVGNYLATPDGERVIVNVMQKNKGRLM